MKSSKLFTSTSFSSHKHISESKKSQTAAVQAQKRKSPQGEKVHTSEQLTRCIMFLFFSRIYSTYIMTYIQKKTRKRERHEFFPRLQKVYFISIRAIIARKTYVYALQTYRKHLRYRRSSDKLNSLRGTNFILYEHMFYIPNIIYIFGFSCTYRKCKDIGTT